MMVPNIIGPFLVTCSDVSVLNKTGCVSDGRARSRSRVALGEHGLGACVF